MANSGCGMRSNRKSKLFIFIIASVTGVFFVVFRTFADGKNEIGGEKIVGAPAVRQSTILYWTPDRMKGAKPFPISLPSKRRRTNVGSDAMKSYPTQGEEGYGYFAPPKSQHADIFDQIAP